MEHTEQAGQSERQYRVYYTRFSPYVGHGSRAIVEAYAGGARWNYPSEIPVDPPALFTIARLRQTHILAWELTAPSLGEVYHRMQVERWDSASWAAIEERLPPLMHISMTAGDVAEDVASGQFFEYEPSGWRQLA